MKGLWALCVLPSVALAAVAAGCSGSSTDDPNKGNGALHEGNFVYACTAAGDAFCADGAAALLPEGIALGAEFGLAFDDGSSRSMPLDADPAFFDVGADGVLHAKRAGYGAVLARAPNGDAVDFVNLLVHEVAGLAIRGTSPTTLLGPGDTLAVRAEPLDGANAPLAGTLAYDWESDRAGVIAVTVSDDDRAHGGATLRAIAPGAARIRVLSGTSTGSVDVQVGGG